MSDKRIRGGFTINHTYHIIPGSGEICAAYILPLVLQFVLNFTSCGIPNSIDDPALVSNLRFSPSAFDSFIRNTELKYTLKEPLAVSAYIVKKDSMQNSILVRTLIENSGETKGTHAITWLGDTNQRYFAPVGTYFGVVRIESHCFETSVQVFHF